MRFYFFQNAPNIRVVSTSCQNLQVFRRGVPINKLAIFFIEVYCKIKYVSMYNA